MSHAPRRVVQLHVGGVIASELSCSFKVQSDLSPKPNTADIEIRNAAEATRAAWSASDAGVSVELRAGYAGERLARVFSGQLRDVNHKHDHGTWVTTISSGDGDQASAQASAAFAAGSTLSAAYARVAQEMKVGLGQLGASLGVKIPGTTIHGKSLDELARVSKAYGLTPTIQDGELHVIEEGKALPGRYVDASTGMIGSPEIVTKRVKDKKQRQIQVTHLMTADIRPGYLLEVGGEGQWLIKSVTWQGDTHGADWYVVALGVPLR